MVELFSKYNKILLIFVITAFISLNVKHVKAVENVNDPFESVNRNIFKFNNNLDDYFFKPVAKGWRKIPDIPRKPLTNLATTAKTPISLANAILQLNKQSIGNIIGRFLINMTFGLGGLFDVASTDEFGNMTEVEEDFGQTLAVWGVPDGPYVMLPIFGPSSVRDAFGLGVDTITNPLSFGYRMNGIGLEARLSGPVVRGVSTREKYLDYLDEMKEGSLDFYATMRSLYRQKRRKDISGELESKDLSLSMLPFEAYEDDELKVDDESKSDVKNIVTTMKDDDSEIKPEMTRYYNGVLPSSNYPAFNESRVNLIE
jgi:phospholipid-binding lipoprotein MlaA